MAFIKAVDSAAAHHKGGNLHPGPDIQPAGALRAKQRLVPGKAEHIDPQCLHIHRHGTRCLGGIHEKQQAVLFCKSGYERQVRAVSGDIGSTGHNHSPGVGTEQLLKLRITEHTVCLHIHKAHLNPLPLEAVEGPQDGIVLTDRGDDMIPRAKEPVDGRVQCLGRIGCKGDAGRAFGMEEPSQRFPGLVDDAGGVQGGRMGSTARVARCLQSIQHRLPHLRGLVQGGRGVIKVDHGLTTFPAFSIFSAMTYILVTPPTASFSVMP